MKVCINYPSVDSKYSLNTYKLNFVVVDEYCKIKHHKKGGKK